MTTTTNWFDTSYPARLEEKLDNNMVKCHLSPRNCIIAPGRRGFCGVRANQDGNLVSLNYGKSVHATVETIETEAIYHYAPGDRILSMGNVGCMLNCDYCHNWKTSQARFVENENVHYYTSEQVVETALRHGIRVISWTYNDPVVWHEFVVETAALAQKHGIINLYKSAFFITPRAIDELLPVIDIFAVSLKSTDPDYYKKLTKGWIEPVKAGAEQVYKAGKHVEISNLMVTDISDTEEDAKRLADWVGTDLDAHVPIHYVRFHPDYKMINTIRTPVERLERARDIAKGMGIKHVYLGNVYDSDSVNTYCSACNHLQVTRYGLNAEFVGLDLNGNCDKCGTPAGFKMLSSKPEPRPFVSEPPSDEKLSHARFEWHGDVRALHVQVKNENSEPIRIYTRRFGDESVPVRWEVTTLAAGESYRYINAKSTPTELGVDVMIPTDGVRSTLHEVFDRAHFPTVTVDAGTLNDDVTPMPAYKGVGMVK